jgi:predicted component of type VI protein secretion system
MSDSTKEELVTNIKDWIKIDTEITTLQNEIKERKIKKKLLTDSLMKIMTKNDIDMVNIAGGSIVYKKNTVKKALNSKSLLNSLNTYLSDSKKAEELANFILDNREQSVKETITRKYST